MGGMGGASSIKVEVYGYSFDNTDRVARQIQSGMLQDPSFTQVTLSRDEYTPEFQMNFAPSWRSTVSPLPPRLPRSAPR